MCLARNEGAHARARPTGAGGSCPGVDAELLGPAGLTGPVTLVPSALVKGLEFDAVVLLEPAALAASGPHGLRSLYVALTRAVSSLLVLHAEELPASAAFIQS